MSESPDQPAAGGQAPADDVPHKRTRVLLSCAPCRVSKLKCDRTSPCSNCLKKGRADLCVYAPRPKKPAKPAKGMAARLKRLEGMLREMMEEDGAASTMSKFGEARPGPAATAAQSAAQSTSGAAGSTVAAAAATAALPGPPGTASAKAGRPGRPVEETNSASAGRVVMGQRATTYVGATHFMAMLDDIEDLKNYFEYPQDPSEDDLQDGSPEGSSPEMMMMGCRSIRSKYDLLALLPPRAAVDPLISRYFASNTPSHYIVHRPTFSKQYSEFWLNPSRADIQWLGILYGVMALGVHFLSLSSLSSPNEVQAQPWAEQFKRYRSAASWAIAASKFANPSLRSIQGLMLYTEAEFLVNRASQTNCWLLSAVGIRLMLNMGLHRDPSKLPNISAFDGEMRRRMWNLAIQLDLIVSFHLGLPSMIHGIPSDTTLPTNLLDDDFDEDTQVLPPARPDSEYTDLSYMIFKSMVCRVFGQVARLSHTLTPPTYAEVMRTDALLADKWRQIPDFMKVRPLADCVTDPPSLVVQRFGVAALFQKSRCVLHRPYLVEAVPRPEHAYSRRTCLQAALKLLEYHDAIHDATQPGGLLHQIGWFVTGLGMHDFLLAAMIVYLVVQNEALFDGELLTTGSSTAAAAAAASTDFDYDWRLTSPLASTGVPTVASLSSSAGGAPSSSLYTASSAAATTATTDDHAGGSGALHQLPVDRDTLVDLLSRSYRIWASVATNYHEVNKAAELLDVMIKKIHTRTHQRDAAGSEPPPSAASAAGGGGPGSGDIGMPPDSQMPVDSSALLGSLSLSGVDLASAPAPYGMVGLDSPTLGQDVGQDLGQGFGQSVDQGDVQTAFMRQDLVPSVSGAADVSSATAAGSAVAAAPNVFDSWMPLSLESLDWGMVDNGLRASAAQPEGWIDQAQMDDISYVATGLWDHPDVL